MTDYTLITLTAIVTGPLYMFAAARLVAAIRGPYGRDRGHTSAARRGDGRAVLSQGDVDGEIVRQIGACMAEQREG